MASTPSGDLIQVIDYDGEMTADISKWMKEQGLDDVGFEFNVVTILGSQSSGKSTLMNSLFGCSFQVMDALKGYSQTTKGLWVGRNKPPSSSSSSSSGSSSDSSTSSLSRPVLILDVEGLDSRERGDRRHTYENFFSLFALALADCLMLNINCSALGCHTGSGFGLLKTVMEANLELFAQHEDNPKTILLFVVRDWAPTLIPEGVMKERIERDYVNKIWKEIEKPDSAAAAAASDFFTVKVVGLAHKLLSPQEFEQDVNRLRDRWTREFSPKTYSRKVPSDGFGAYAKSIWETIKQQSHLDIPNQKEMLAIYRCQDLKQQALLAAAARTATLQQQHPKPTAADAAAIKKEMTEIAQEAVSLYLSHAKRYQEKICQNVKAELIQGLIATLKPLVDAQLTEAKARIARRLKETLREAYIRDPNDPTASTKGELMVDSWAAFKKRSTEAAEEAESAFREAGQGCDLQLEDGEILTFPRDLIEEALMQEIKQEIDVLRDGQRKALDEAITEKCGDGFVGLEVLLTARDFSPVSFWETCRGRAAANASVCAAHFAAAAEGLNDPSVSSKFEGEFSENFAVRCRRLSLLQLRATLAKLVGAVNIYILERFNNFFVYDEEDQPRRWELLSAEKLQSLFLIAKTQALSLLPTLREMQLEGLSLSSPTLQALAVSTPRSGKETKQQEEEQMPASFFKPLLDTITEQSIQRKALLAMQNQCREAQLLQQRCGNAASWRSVPLWGWLLLVCLGWNELSLVFSFAANNWLTLPLLLLVLLLGAAVVISGKVEIASQGIRHAVQLVRLLLQPFLYGLLKRVTDMMDPSALAGSGVMNSAGAKSSRSGHPKDHSEEVAELKERVSHMKQK